MVLLRIACICADLSRNPLVRVYPIAKVLARHHDVTVMGFRSRPEIFAPYRDEFEYQTMALRRYPGFAEDVRAMARTIDADVVFAFKPLSSSLWPALVARRRLGIPVVLDVEDWEAGWYGDVAASDRIRHLAHVERPNGYASTLLNERLARRADRTFVVSTALQRRFGGTILPHGADTSVFDPALYGREDALRLLGVPDDRYVVFTGTPMPSKGLDELRLAFDLMSNRGVRLLVVGSSSHDDAYVAELSRQFGDRAIFMGPRPHHEMPYILSLADAVAIPQRPSNETETQIPGKVFEAMAMARPIVASAVSDLPLILRECGWIASPDSPGELAKALDEVFDDPQAAAEVGARARQRCIEGYSWDAMERILGDGLAF